MLKDSGGGSSGHGCGECSLDNDLNRAGSHCICFSCWFDTGTFLWDDGKAKSKAINKSFVEEAFVTLCVLVAREAPRKFRVFKTSHQFRFPVVVLISSMSYQGNVDFYVILADGSLMGVILLGAVHA